MPIPPFIDAHLHFWDLTRFPYPWLNAPDVRDLRQDYLPADWREDAIGLPVRGLVHVQAEVDHRLDPVLETAWLEDLGEIADRTPMACVGYADLATPNLAEVLDQHARHGLFRGIRQEAWFDPQSTRADVPRTNLLDDPRWGCGLTELARRDLCFDLLVWAHQLPQASDIFRALPDLRLVLEHTGLPPFADTDAMTRWKTDLAAFARAAPRSVLKISAMGFLSAGWTPDDITPVILTCIDIFGPDRCLLGSNFPVEKRHGSYGRLWAAYDTATVSLTAAERAEVFEGVAARTYRFETASRTAA